MERTTLVQHLRQEEMKIPGATGEFTGLMNEILVASKIISTSVNKAGIGEDILGLTGAVNVHGEKVQKLDEYANDIFVKVVSQSGYVSAIASEELNEPVRVKLPPNASGKYIFMTDPLDGSSNIDVNVSIGSIFSIYRKQDKPASTNHDGDLLQAGNKQIAAGYAVYGSSTMFVYTTTLGGVHGFTLDPGLGEFFLSHPNIKIPAQGSTYSINEGNRIRWDENQKKAVEYLKADDAATKRPYGHRYIGSLVADFHRTLLKGGIFMYPADQKSPGGKLRYYFEAAPLAMIVENAGGRASDGRERILDIVPASIHQRVPLFIGSKQDVETVEKILAGKS